MRVARITCVDETASRVFTVIMAFVKLDCGILDSTIWIDRDAREIFITALLMAEPFELTTEAPQIEVRTLAHTGFMAPPGWYGFIPAAGSGIVRRAGLDAEAGLAALERLGAPEEESRTPDFGGRRLIRIDGGFLVLNFDRYRKKDHTSAERSRRYRESRIASRVANVTPRVTTRSVTQAEAEAKADMKDIQKEAKASRVFVPPSADEVKAYSAEIGYPLDGQAWCDSYAQKGWMVGKTKMKDWKAAVRNWKANGWKPNGGSGMNGHSTAPSRPVEKPRFADDDPFLVSARAAYKAEQEALRAGGGL